MFNFHQIYHIFDKASFYKINKILNMKKIILLASAALLFFACTSQKVDKGTAANTIVPASAESLSQGKMIYENSCGRCHDLPDVTKYNDEKWKSLVAWMAPKSRLNAQQADLVYFYVSTSN